MRQSSLLAPVHELEPLRHRIIVFKANGIPDAGPWFPVNEIAVHAQFFACAEPGSGLPPGIFRVTAVPYQELRS